jgi:hypothetical protein
MDKIRFYIGKEHTAILEVDDPDGLDDATVILSVIRYAGDETVLLRKTGVVTDPDPSPPEPAPVDPCYVEFTFDIMDTIGMVVGAYRYFITVFHSNGSYVTNEGFFELLAHEPTERPTLPGVTVVHCTATFTDASGAPVPQKVIVSVVDVAQVAAGVIAPTGTTVHESLRNGTIDIPLVVGLRIRVAIEGTKLIREFVVPNTDFDLLSALSAATDMFTVQSLPSLLPRRTL